MNMKRTLIILTFVILSQAVTLRIHKTILDEKIQHQKNGNVEIGSIDDIDSPAAKSQFKTQSDTDLSDLDDTKIKDKFKDFEAQNGKKYKNSDEQKQRADIFADKVKKMKEFN